MVEKQCPNCRRPYFMGDTERIRTCGKCGFPLISDRVHPDVQTVYREVGKWIHQNLSTTPQTRQEILQRQDQEIKALQQQLGSQSSVKPRLPEFESIQTSPRIDTQRIQFELKQTASLAHLQQENLRLRDEVSQFEQENQHLNILNTQLKDRLKAEQSKNQDLSTQLESVSQEQKAGISDRQKAAELAKQIYCLLAKDVDYLADERLHQIGHPIHDNPSVQPEAVVNSSMPAGSEMVLNEPSPVDRQINLPWLRFYNQDSEQFPEIAKPIALAATGTSLGDRWVARGTPATFEEGAGSYFLIETDSLYYLVPNRKRFHFNESSLDSIQVCFEFKHFESDESSEDSDLSQYDLTQFEVIYPAEVFQNETSQWQLQKRGLIQFQLRNS